MQTDQTQATEPQGNSDQNTVTPVTLADDDTPQVVQVMQADGQLIRDEYVALMDAPPPATAAVLLRVEQLPRLPELLAAGHRVGLLLTVEDSPETLTLPVTELALIAIEFASFADGRGYSFATLLRRQGFGGELRAVGDVFKDTLFYLKRSGFTQFVLKGGKDLEVARTGLQDFTKGYQASTADPYPHFQTGKGITVQ